VAIVHFDILDTPVDMPLPLQTLRSWQPFRLDALGLVTLLGADEVACAVGALSPNFLTDFMPLLGAYRIAGNQFTANEPGYTMYNLTDGVTNTELSAWFTRWLSQFVTEWVAMDLEVKPKRKFLDFRRIASFLLGTATHFILIAFAIVQGDWYGLANATGLLFATWVRNYLIYANLSGYDVKFSELEKKSTEKKKVLIVRPDGGLVVMYVELRLLLSLFGKVDPAATKYWMYTVARGVGWLAFGVHIVSIGQATLPSQLLAVGVMALATALTIFNVGTQQLPHSLRKRRSSKHHEAQQSGEQNYEMGSRVTIKVQPLEGGTRTKDEQQSMKPPARVPTAGVSADGTMQSEGDEGESKPGNSVNGVKAKAPKPRGPARREMYWLLGPNKTEQRWMREWGLLALMPNKTWYEGWYSFLKERNVESDGPWRKLDKFLGIARAEMYVGNDTNDKSTSTEPEDSGDIPADPGQALPGASDVSYGPGETTSAA
jgi:hypothetical protein